MSEGSDSFSSAEEEVIRSFDGAIAQAKHRIEQAKSKALQKLDG